jgi:hypothetical protein
MAAFRKNRLGVRATGFSSDTGDNPGDAYIQEARTVKSVLRSVHVYQVSF